MIIGYSSNEGLLFASNVDELMKQDIKHFLKSYILHDNDEETVQKFSRRLFEMYELDKNENNTLLVSNF